MLDERMYGRVAESSQKEFLAIELSPSSRRHLLSWWQGATGILLLKNLFAHHITIKPDPTPDELKRFAIGSKLSVRVSGWAADGKGQVAVVTGIGLPDGRTPHVTIATSGIRPAYSNELLRSGHVAASGPRLDGEVKMLPRFPG